VLPDFPWDVLEPYAVAAAAHPNGIVDLSVGTPVDPTPAVVQSALVAAADAPGYPRTQGTAALRNAASEWLTRRLSVTVTAADVLPLIGTKEFVAALPSLLGLGAGDEVLLPELAYPTYDVGARLAGAVPVPADDLPGDVDPARNPDGSADGTRVRLVWLNSPSNPTGRVLPVEHMRKVVEWAREHHAVVASDECYIELGWDAEPVSVLHPDVSDGSTEGLLAVHSLSKRSNLAGYRAGFVAGDPQLIGEFLEVRKHTGFMVPAPIQAAMTAALADDEHVLEQRAVYSARRAALRTAIEAAGFTVAYSEAGLYLWATRGQPCWQTVADLAELGILVAPGDFYGAAGAEWVRIAITATDERVAAAVARLATW
jgi:succinyldiaminopimelate transaminase